MDPAEIQGDWKENEVLSKHTYYRIGGPARYFAQPKHLDDLKVLKRWILQYKVPYFVMGKGSNLLVADAGYSGLVIKIDKLSTEIQPVPNQPGLIQTGASVTVSTLLRKAAQEGWAGLEFLTGIPGSIGGVICMNGGTHLGEAKDQLHSVTCFELEKPSLDWQTYSGDMLRFSYRKNHFLEPGQIVTYALWSIKQENPKTVENTIQELLKRRKSSQPVDFPSCGSVFKNPYESGMRSWQVIDKLGLRGYRQGDAQFSEKHPNFILNLGQATAHDVLSLIELAKSRALSELQITLQEEVQLLGFPKA